LKLSSLASKSILLSNFAQKHAPADARAHACAAITTAGEGKRCVSGSAGKLRHTEAPQGVELLTTRLREARGPQTPPSHKPSHRLAGRGEEKGRGKGMGGRKKAAPLPAEKGKREMLRVRRGLAGALWRNFAKTKHRLAQPPARAVRVPFRVVARCKADRSRTPPLKRLPRSLRKGTSLSTAGAAKGQGKALGGGRKAVPLLQPKWRAFRLVSIATCRDEACASALRSTSGIEVR
jgi:hypothetical protein